MHSLLRQAYQAEMSAAVEQYKVKAWTQAFTYLERAHILGQAVPLEHARAHWWMLKVGWKQRDLMEILGQLPRIAGSLLFSRIWIPKGNTGGARASAFKSMPIPEDLQSLLMKYSGRH